MKMDERLKTAIDLARMYPDMEPEDLMQNLDLRKEPCPENRCGHLVNEHIRVNEKLVCTAEGCSCKVNETYAMGVIIAEYQEAGGSPAPPPARDPLAIPEDLFAPIVGFDDIKDILRLSLASERPVHQYLWGPPASAKTLFMLELERLGDARYTLGSTSSRAGFRQLLMDTRPRFLLIDELDKGRGSDYSVLLSAMESGIMVDTHYDRHQRVNLDLWVFAAGNTKDRIWPEILSRFGEGLRIEPYTPEEFLEVAARVLVMREGASEEIARVVAAATLQQLRSRDVRHAIRVYRLARTAEDVPKVVETLRQRR